ncbi:TPA: hypothetical protein SUB30_002405 [Bacillus pseudomycoides]|nr:hypothetical protein [Bacillus pseudomycoides]
MKEVIVKLQRDKRIQNIIIIAGLISILLGPEKLNIYTGILYGIILTIIVYVSSYVYLEPICKGGLYSVSAVLILAVLYGIFTIFFPSVHYIVVIIIIGVVCFTFTYLVGK